MAILSKNTGPPSWQTPRIVPSGLWQKACGFYVALWVRFKQGDLPTLMDCGISCSGRDSPRSSVNCPDYLRVRIGRLRNPQNQSHLPAVTYRLSAKKLIHGIFALSLRKPSDAYTIGRYRRGNKWMSLI